MIVIAGMAKQPRVLDLPLRGMKAMIEYHSRAAMRLTKTFKLVQGKVNEGFALTQRSLRDRKTMVKFHKSGNFILDIFI